MIVTERVSKFVTSMRIYGNGLPAQFNQWLAGLPTVQFQALVSALLAMSTALVYYILLWKAIKIDSVNFGMWLGFVAAYGGIAYRQFAKKRDSFKPEISSKQNTEDKG